MSGISLDSFLDRLGLEEGELRVCVWLAFMEGNETVLPSERAIACLGWVVAVQERRMASDAFRSELRAFLEELGNTLTDEELEIVAKCMLSGHAEPEPER